MSLADDLALDPRDDSIDLAVLNPPAAERAGHEDFPAPTLTVLVEAMAAGVRRPVHHPGVG
jgi:hypothetical protein